MSRVHDPTICALGEGPLWHPLREQLFWFDIIRYRLHTREGDRTKTWQFDEHVSAAGWVDEERFLIASETKLFLFNVETGQSEDVCPLEADNHATRSNDGRADPFGGFWIGTMGKAAEPGAGAIYRFYHGEARLLYPNITVPNAISFTPDGRFAYWTDSHRGQIMRQPLDPADGWPEGEPALWLDLSSEGIIPDGAVVDAEGNLWNAQWRSWRVACYSPEGAFLRAVPFNASQTSCPAFGGDNLTTLYCTSARDSVESRDERPSAQHGMTFAADNVAQGLPERQVKL